MLTPYDVINSLEELVMIAGDSTMLYFNVVDNDDVPVDISTGTSSWVLSPYGDETSVALTKSGTIESTSQFSIELDTADTASLKGKFVQQCVHVDFLGKEFRKQGLVTIVPRID